MQAENYGATLEQRLSPTVMPYLQLMKMVMQNLHVAYPAVVNSFSPGPPATVSVQVAVKEYVQQNTSAPGSISVNTEAVPLPEMQQVPVVFPSAGGWSLTFPIQPGDECLVVFADTSIDMWLQNGWKPVDDPISRRRHSLSDAIAIFGLRSTPRGLANYSATSAQLRSDDGTVVIDLAAGQATVTAPKVTVNCTDKAEINASTANVNATGTATVQAPTVNVDGSTAVNITGGAVTIGPSTKIDGHPFVLHTHVLGAGVTGAVSLTP